jgi:polar amino acid transport system substrate-binding protein
MASQRIIVQPFKKLGRVLRFLVCGGSIISFAAAQAQETNKPPLRWAADSEGGAPFIFPDPQNPSLVLGFEVDLVAALAAELQREPAFVQNQWDGLVPGLRIDNYDIIVNGLEITPDREREINFSTPYYVTFEQLTVRKDTYDLNSLQDCAGKIVGTLKASLAERILQAQANLEIRPYDGQITAYEDLALGRLDAVLMDHPIALYYGYTHPKLKFVGDPIGEMKYGIGLRKEDEALRQEINQALQKLTANGALRAIYERWNLWTPRLAEFFQDLRPSNTPPSAWQAFLREHQLEKTWQDKIQKYFKDYLPLLARAAVTTIGLSISSMLLAILFGLILALMRLYAIAPFSSLATAYIETVRGTPLLVQLLFIYYALPQLVGVKLTPVVAAVAGLSLNYAAYEAENYRAGILSIPRSQMEAALALGMTRWQGLQHVIIPQALRLVIPPVTNDFISLIKDSSIVSVIAMVELTREYQRLAGIDFDYLGLGLLVAAMYFLIGFPFVRLAGWAEKHFSFDKRLPNKKQKENGRKQATLAPSTSVH